MKEKKKNKEGQRGELIRERERKKKEKNLVLLMGSMIFNLFTKRPLSNATWKLKTGLDEFLKYMF